MDLNKTYLDMSVISTLCLKVGNFSHEKASKLLADMNQRFSRFTFTSAVIADLKEKAKTNFPQRVYFFLSNLQKKSPPEKCLVF